ncbi:MAG: urea ABC transporter substrate-binding protein [Puniceicoccales bacterium]
MLRPTLLIIFTLTLAWLTGCGERRGAEQTVKVGVLHSQTGSMKDSEAPVINAVLMAIDEINASGYLPGIRIEPVVRDGKSNELVFADEAEDLLRDEGVSAIFGGWTSASRKAMIPVLERHNGLLFYPVQYEGSEMSPNIVYTGATPNQQIIPTVYWAMEDEGAKRFFLVGSDYIFPRMANEIIKDQVKALGGEIVGERYFPLGSDDVGDIAQAIKEAQPDFILNTINGDTNGPFFTALREAGVTSDDVPTLSFSVDENLLASIGARQMVGDYAAWNYFQSLPSKANRGFVRRFQERSGKDTSTTDAMEAAYSAVYLWADAIHKGAETRDHFNIEDAHPSRIRSSIENRSFDAPGGMVFVDPRTHHLYKTARIGRIVDDGQFQLEWESESPVRPKPYPIFRPMEAWEDQLSLYQQGWDGKWSAPQD